MVSILNIPISQRKSCEIHREIQRELPEVTWLINSRSEPRSQATWHPHLYWQQPLLLFWGPWFFSFSPSSSKHTLSSLETNQFTLPLFPPQCESHHPLLAQLLPLLLLSRSVLYGAAKVVPSKHNSSCQLCAQDPAIASHQTQLIQSLTLWSVCSRPLQTHFLLLFLGFPSSCHSDQLALP